jgi:predicted adenylyl cyclase CyaB
MARNIEIKARARQFEIQRRVAEELVNGNAVSVVQEDTFFNVSKGRLKLRILEDGPGELIYYERSDSVGPKESQYVRSRIDDPAALREVLSRALGVRGVVRKRRSVYVHNQTRIHFDEVERLGCFIELEVMLQPNQTIEEGAAIAQELIGRLKIETEDLVPVAYVDLL